MPVFGIASWFSSKRITNIRQPQADWYMTDILPWRRNMVIPSPATNLSRGGDTYKNLQPRKLRAKFARKHQELRLQGVENASSKHNRNNHGTHNLVNGHQQGGRLMLIPLTRNEFWPSAQKHIPSVMQWRMRRTRLSGAVHTHIHARMNASLPCRRTQAHAHASATNR